MPWFCHPFSLLPVFLCLSLALTTTPLPSSPIWSSFPALQTSYLSPHGPNSFFLHLQVSRSSFRPCAGRKVECLYHIKAVLSRLHVLRSQHVHTTPGLGWAATEAAPHLDTITQPQVPENGYNDDAYFCLYFKVQGTEESNKSGMLGQALAMPFEA